MERLGIRIAKLRKKADLSQGALAKKIGRTRSTISQLEAGTTNNPRPVNLVGLANVFGLSVEDMVKGTDAESKVQTSHSSGTTGRVVVLSITEAELIDRLDGDQELAAHLIGLIDSIRQPGPPGSAPPKKKRGH